MSQIKVLSLAFAFGLICGTTQAQEVSSPREETQENMQTSSGLSGFGETYGEQIAREQEEQARAAQEAQAEAQENQNSVLAKVPENNTIDYKGIANAFFAGGQNQAEETAAAQQAKAQPKTYEDIVFTITEPTSQITLGMGHTLDLKLRTSSNLKWNFDKEFKSLEYISERTEDGFFHIVFKAKAPGQETLYFDCLDVGNPTNIQVLETKLIVVKVE